MELFLALLVKPFVVLLVMLPVVLIAALLHRYMPDCKLKRVLFAPLPGHKRRWD